MDIGLEKLRFKVYRKLPVEWSPTGLSPLLKITCAQIVYHASCLPETLYTILSMVVGFRDRWI